MRIITLNANGIRSAARKGFFDWLPAQDADVVCVQETKCQRDQIADPLFHPRGYHCYYFDAVKKGYSGVAVYSREKPLTVVAGHGSREFDTRGPLHRGALQGPERDFALPAVRLLERGAPAGQVPLPRGVHAVPARAEAQAAQLHPVRRLEHRAQGNRPAQLEVEPEELGLPAGRARLARRTVRRRRLRRRVPRGQRRTRPVHLVVQPRPGLDARTSAGASTTRC